MEKTISPEAFERFKARLQEIDREYTAEIKEILKEATDEKLLKIREQIGLH